LYAKFGCQKVAYAELLCQTLLYSLKNLVAGPFCKQNLVPKSVVTRAMRFTWRPAASNHRRALKLCSRPLLPFPLPSFPYQFVTHAYFSILRPSLPTSEIVLGRCSDHFFVVVKSSVLFANVAADHSCSKIFLVCFDANICKHGMNTSMVRQGVNVIADAGIAQHEVPKPKNYVKKNAFLQTR
jgi:hypothetical protein